MNEPMNKLLPSIAGLLFLAGSISGCTTDGNGATPETGDTPSVNRRVVRVDTEILQPTTFEDVVQITGTIEAPNDATLSAQSGGTLVELKSLGSRVMKGDIVALLDDELLAAGLRQAEALLDVQTAQEALALDNFNRREPLFRDSIISAIEFESVRVQLIQARAQRSQAESVVAQTAKQLENTRVRAPFDGTVEERFVDEGEQLLPGSPILRVVNTNRIRVVAGVPERYASDIGAGSLLRARFSSYGIGEMSGTIRFAGQVIDPANRTFRVEVDMANPGGHLKPSMIVNLLITRETMTEQLVIPQAAVLRDESRVTVFVVTSPGDGTVQLAERRTVTLGASFGGRAVVLSGLSAGDEIIVTGQTNVTEGDAVEIANRSSSD